MKPAFVDISSKRALRRYSNDLRRYAVQATSSSRVMTKPSSSIMR